MQRKRLQRRSRCSWAEPRYLALLAVLLATFLVAFDDADRDLLDDTWEQAHGLPVGMHAASDLHSAWPLDDASGNLAADLGPKNQPLKLKRDAMWISNGLFYGGVSLDGQGDFLKSTNAGVYDLTNFTFSAWIRTTNDTKQTLVRWLDNDGFGWWLGTRADGRLQARIDTPEDIKQRVKNDTVTNLVNDGEWHMVAFTYNRASNLARIYLDGDLEAERPLNGRFKKKANDFDVGQQGWGGWWKGYVDDIRFYGRDLGPEEIPLLADAFRDMDNDGLSNLGEFQAGSSPLIPDSDGDGRLDGADPAPTDYYDGSLPILNIMSGNFQRGPPATWLSEMLTVQVTDTSGNPLPNAPIVFTVAQGDSLIARSMQEAPAQTLALRTDMGGQASVLAFLPPLAGESALIHVTAQSGTGTMQTTFSIESFADAAAPTIDPPGGAFEGEVTVTLSSDMPDAQIHYTLDGSDPTESSTLYAGSFVLGPSDTPITIRARTALAGYNPSAVAAAEFHIVPRTIPNLVFFTGSNNSTVALDMEGGSWGWGSNDSGQLGTANDQARALPGRSLLPKLAAIACDGSHALGLVGDGTVISWGSNSYGQLGDGTQSDIQLTPLSVPGLTNVVAISTGTSSSFALKSDGTLWSWGGTIAGEIGDGTSFSGPAVRPTPAQILTNVKSIATGAGFGLAVTDSGTVYGWGANWFGAMGGSLVGTPFPHNPSPRMVDDLSDVQMVKAGAYHTLALKTDGTLWTLGANTSGQLGIGTQDQVFTTHAKPSRVLGLENIVMIAAGYYHNLALRSDGTVWAWGHNVEGELGDGTNNNRTSPVQVVDGIGFLENVVSVFATRYTSYAIKSDGSIYAWGANWSGQLGDGTKSNRLAPVRLFQTPQPELSPPPGTYQDVQSVRVSLPVEGGAQIHYTLENREPTQADPMIESEGTITVAGPVLLRLKAWKAGYLPSAPLTAKYTVIPDLENPADRDADGMLDSWEALHGLNPADGTDAMSDADGDGLLNYQEHQKGTDPQTVDPLPTPPPPIEGLEAVQRALQKRYQAVLRENIIFPSRSDGTAPPLYPPNGFYASDSTNAIKMASIVQFMAAKLDDRQFLAKFVYAAEGDLENAPEIAFYTDSQLPPTSNITTQNYQAKLEELGAKIVKLRHPWLGWPGLVFNPPWQSWATGTWVERSTRGRLVERFGDDAVPEPIIAEVESAFAAGWVPIEDVYSPTQVSGGKLFFVDPVSGRAFFSASEEARVIAEKVVIRGKLQFDFSRFEGPVRIYLRCHANRSDGPVPGDLRYHAIAEAEAGGVFTTPLIGDLSTFPFDWQSDQNSSFWLMEGWMAVMTDDFIVPQVNIAVDANRDGEITFDEADKTTPEKPHRFWCNEDNDVRLVDGSENDIESSEKDSDDIFFGSKRDLEDFARIWVQVTPGLENVTVELFWRNFSGTPAINLFDAFEADGGTKYLTDEEIASNQVLGTQISKVFGNTPHTFAPGTFADGQVKHFIFEGAGEGTGELVLQIKKGSDVIAESSVHLDLKSVKKMYQRAKATPETIEPAYNYGTEYEIPPEPDMGWSFDSGDHAFQPDPNESKQYIIFVHGWNMSPWGSYSYAETLFKRLWHRGFKGRFAVVRWPTYYSETFDSVPKVGEVLDGYLARYNDSEYIAWKSGKSLKQFVETLPADYAKNLVAHSMGNIVVGSALREGLVIDNYALLQAAVPAVCYDERAALYQPPTQGEFGFTYWNTPTPDSDADPATKALAYGGQLKNVSGNLVNFFLPQDEATTRAWEFNNDRFKPQRFNLGTTGYFYEPSAPAGQRLGLTFAFEVGRLLRAPHEAMAHANQSPTKVVGAEGRTAEAIDGSINLASAEFSLPGNTGGFQSEHSAQFIRNIQTLKPFHDRLMDELGVPRNP